MAPVQTERVEIPLSGGGTMGGFVARPASGGPHPAVVVYMEIFGVNSHIQDVVQRVAGEGYVAIAPDFFHRTGAGIELGYDDAGMEKGMSLLNQLVADEMVSDARDAVAYARDRDDTTDAVGCMGFCIGGHMAYLTACEADVAASASFYGGGVAAPEGLGGGPSTVSRTEGIEGRILCLFGGEDALIPSDQVDAIRTALGKAGTDHEVVVYQGSDHGFFCDQRATYDADAAKDAWRRVKELFSSTLR